MTIHELANLLEHLQRGLGEYLKAGAATAISDVVTLFRETPDQDIKEFTKRVRAANQPGQVVPPKSARGGRAAPVNVEELIGRIRDLQSGQAAPSVSNDELEKLTSDQLKAVLRAFGRPVTGSKGVLVGRVRSLCPPASADSPSLPPPSETGPATPPPSVPAQVNLADVEAGVQLYNRLRDDRSLDIQELRNQFEPLRNYSKATLEEICRRVGHTPFGSKANILELLQINLETLKMSQHRVHQILTGT